ncbi:hypothetical protein, partial [Aneurinibacillus migulanus]|uniref:hypothetical protein n=1 Tax=Aneurinibacillus migulanus TaxID=47500 RepID=UPI001F48D3B2
TIKGLSPINQLDLPNCALFFCIQFSKCKSRLSVFILSLLSVALKQANPVLVGLSARSKHLGLSKRETVERIFPNTSNHSVAG